MLPFPSWPKTLSPQYWTVPAVSRAHVWQGPSLMVVVETPIEMVNVIFAVFCVLGFAHFGIEDLNGEGQSNGALGRRRRQLLHSLDQSALATKTWVWSCGSPARDVRCRKAAATRPPAPMRCRPPAPRGAMVAWRSR